MDLHSIAQYISIADVVRNDNQPRLNRWQYWGTSLTNASVFEMPGKFIHEAFTEKPHDLIVGADGRKSPAPLFGSPGWDCV